MKQFIKNLLKKTLKEHIYTTKEYNKYVISRSIIELFTNSRETVKAYLSRLSLLITDQNQKHLSPGMMNYIVDAFLFDERLYIVTNHSNIFDEVIIEDISNNLGIEIKTIEETLSSKSSMLSYFSYFEKFNKVNE